MPKVIALSLGLVVAFGAGPLRAQDAQPMNPNAQRIYNSALGAAAFGAAKADEMIAQRRKEAAAPHGNPQQAFKSVLAAAKHGDLDAQLQAGTMYARGIGVRRNPIQAIDWWTKASMHSPAAQKMAADRLAEILQAKGMPRQQAEVMAMATLLAKFLGADRRRLGQSTGGNGETLAGHIMMDEFINGD